PQFQQLLKDAKSKKFNALICYRLDRISRNVADFSTTLELLQSNNIDFISIKEQFDTSTPMGRAMVYISSVFAQLERETIAERVRDNMLQLAKTGRWLGGQTPLGFEPEKTTYIDEEFKERTLMKLTPNEKELEVIKLIYKTYLEEQSITQVVKKLNLSGIKGKNGGDFNSSQVGRLLRSPIYVSSDEAVSKYLKSIGINVFGTPNGSGYLTYNKTQKITTIRDITEWIAAVAKHQGIINSTDWIQVQELLNKNKDKKVIRLGTGSNNNAALSGILKCAKCGANMLVKHGHNSKKSPGVKYDYYVCSNKDGKYVDKCDNKNIRVDMLDEIIISEMKSYNKELLIEGLKENLKKSTENIEHSQINNLNKQIEEKTIEINNLRKRIAKTDDDEIGDMLTEDLKVLKNEINQLQNSLTNLETNKSDIITESKNLKIVVDTLRNFNNNIDLVDDIAQKRLLIKSIAEWIKWNGETRKFKIKILGMDDSKKK
ncbi:MAG: recombinase family protein, partial [Clostridium sp.]|uniref:recombinase family protein n=1 Tax=Clostridium sp. TaxID=1506 RepID=UPI0025B8E62A